MKKEFIPGKWYKGTRESHYIKFSHLVVKDNYNEVWFTERGEKKIEEPDYWCNSDMDRYALNNPVTQKELLKILGKGHPDLNQEPQYEIY